MKTRVLEARIKGRDKQLHPTVYVGCNYLPLPLVPDSGTQVPHMHIGFNAVIHLRPPVNPSVTETGIV